MEMDKRRTRLGRPPKQEARNTRECILNAALELFAAQGFAGTSLRQIARTVGIKESAIYAHFESKEALYRTIFEQFGPPVAIVDEILGSDLSVIAQREPGYAGCTPKQIAQKMFSYADGCTFSAKKDAFANIGGFLCTNDDRLAQQETDLLILTEGFPTYGGLAGRDLDAIAVGLEEVLDPDYLRYRIMSTGYLGRHIADHGVPIVEPPGGHAIYIDAARMLPHIPPREFPGQALAVELYRHAGIRSVEIGSVMFGAAARFELLRLAIPRRVYTQSHIDYVVEAILEVNSYKERIRGLEIVSEPPVLRHFNARFRPR